MHSFLPHFLPKILPPPPQKKNSKKKRKKNGRILSAFLSHKSQKRKSKNDIIMSDDDDDETARRRQQGGGGELLSAVARKKLHNACVLGDRELLEKAARDGADCRAMLPVFLEDDFDASTSTSSLRGGGGRSMLPLHAAARHNHPEIVSDLISRFAVDVDQEDERGRTALFHAVAMDRVDVVDVLVGRFGANVNHADGAEETPVSTCAKVGSLECLEMLLLSRENAREGSMPDACSPRGQFRLPPMVECACARTDWQTFPKVAKRLRREVAKQRFEGRVEDVDVEYFEIQENEKKTKKSLLMLAVGLGNVHAVRFLCDEWNVDIHRAFEENEENGDVFGPLELARAGKFKECEEELLKRGAKEVNKENTSTTLGATEGAMKEKSSAEKRKAHLQSLVKERERLRFIVQANEDETFQSSMHNPRIKKAVEDVMENFMNVQKYAEDKDVMAALSKWRGCQRFFKQRGEKVTYEEIVVNSNKDGQEAVKERKARIESLGDAIAKEIMDVASSLPKKGNSVILNNENVSRDEDEDESGKREKRSRMFYIRVTVAIIQFLPLLYVLYLRIFRAEEMNFEMKKHPFWGGGMAFDAEVKHNDDAGEL